MCDIEFGLIHEDRSLAQEEIPDKNVQNVHTYL